MDNKLKILSNQAECLKCGDKPYSAHRHDFKHCECGEIFVDGGMSYLRHGFSNKENYKNISISLPEEAVNYALERLDWCDETGRNNLGRLCAVVIALRDSGVTLEVK